MKKAKTALFGRYRPTELSLYKPRPPGQCKYQNFPQFREKAQRQCALLEAIAVEPGKPAKYYAKKLGVNQYVTLGELKVLYEDGIVFKFTPDEGNTVWYLRQLKQEVKSCALN